MNRPIVLPELPPADVKSTAWISRDLWNVHSMREAQRAAVEADREASATEYAMAVRGNYETLLHEVEELRAFKKSITVTDEDVGAADMAVAGHHPAEKTRRILESYAARLREGA